MTDVQTQSIDYIPAAQPLKANGSLEVRYIPISKLRPEPKNARIHTKKQVRQIAESIKAFGFNVPILLDGENNVVAGHGRLLAGKLLGWSEVPTIELRHLTVEQVKAFRIADNRLTEVSMWDDRLLAEQLKDLSILDLSFDLEVMGFEVGEIDVRIESLDPKPIENDPLDVLPASLTTPTVSQPGDLWVLGRHRLLCASALEPESYAQLMGEEKASIVFSDPPYNVPIAGHASGLGAVKHQDFAMACGEMSAAEFTTFLHQVCTQFVRHSVDGSIHFICMHWRHAGELLGAGTTTYSELKNICVWAKSNAGMGSLYRSRHEFVFVFKNGHAPHQNNVQLGQFGRNRTNVWEYPGMTGLRGGGEEGKLLALHPTVKPVALVADAILDCSSRQDVVLDGFLGSGSTLIAAERVGRRCYGLEIEPTYVDTAIRRWEKMTGENAIHVETTETFRERNQKIEAGHVG